MNLAEKLSKIDTVADNRISDADRLYCETHQRAYESAIENLNGLMFYWECVRIEQDDILGDYDKDTRDYSSYILIRDFSVSKVQEKLIDSHEKFIRYIVRYFDKTYNVELDVQRVIDFLIPKKPEYDHIDRVNYDKHIAAWNIEMENLRLNFTDVLDQILIQLDGRTFVERALDEVIHNCRYHSWDDGKPYFEVKGDTIRFRDYFCSYTDWYSHGNWKLTGRMKSIVPALYHYETGRFGDYPYSFNRLFRDFDCSELDFDNDNKLKTIKCFKNGRVDFKFSGKTTAAEFADKYLGWVENGGIAA